MRIISVLVAMTVSYLIAKKEGEFTIKAPIIGTIIGAFIDYYLKSN